MTDGSDGTNGSGPGAGEGPGVVVYTTDFCGWCERAKELLAARGIAYREERIPRTPEGRERLEAIVPGARSFPQIVIDGRTVGGYRELVDLDRAGELERGAA